VTLLGKQLEAPLDQPGLQGVAARLVAGRIVRLTVDQILNLGLTTLTGHFRFKQDSKQDFRIVP